MPVQISRAQSLGFTDLIEKATTENVSSRGLRVLTRRALLPHERLLVTALVGSETPTRARVVYCQPLAGELFGLGLQFEEERRRWYRKIRPSPLAGGLLSPWLK
jgi:hypothetical protein